MTAPRTIEQAMADAHGRVSAAPLPLDTPAGLAFPSGADTTAPPPPPTPGELGRRMFDPVETPGEQTPLSVIAARMFGQ